MKLDAKFSVKFLVRRLEKLSMWTHHCSSTKKNPRRKGKQIKMKIRANDLQTQRSSTFFSDDLLRFWCSRSNFDAVIEILIAYSSVSPSIAVQDVFAAREIQAHHSERGESRAARVGLLLSARPHSSMAPRYVMGPGCFIEGCIVIIWTGCWNVD